MNPIKLALARWFDRLRLAQALLRLQSRLYMPYVRAVNYHDVPPSLGEAFEAQLRFYAKHFVPVGRTELRALLSGNWPHEKPGILLSFDDGLRSHAAVVAPLLEKHGFSGWFMVPPGFVDEPTETQATFADRHWILCDREWQPDPRLALSWEEVRLLADRHVVCSHSFDHDRLSSVRGSRLHREIFESKARLEHQIGKPIDAFCWVGGEESSYSAEAAHLIRQAGYKLGFMTNNRVITPTTDPLQLQRTNVEADLPMEVVRLQISGFLDALYTYRRGRVNRLTATR